MNKEHKFLLLQYVEILCLFLASIFALVGFYFGIEMILLEDKAKKGLLQCIVTSIAFLTLFILGISSIKSVKRYKEAVKEDEVD